MIVLFDLDGTLTDPYEGITRSVQYALRHFGIEESNRQTLAAYIGPPLREMFMQQHGLSEEQSLEALAQYRVRFSDVGMFENRVYDGVERLLSRLKAAGMRLAVATSKPTVFSEKILAHFGLAGYFEEIVGSELNGHRVEKADVIEEAMRRLAARPHEVWMVGDRSFDVQGAHTHGVRAVGVTYGYAAPGELSAAGADAVVDTVDELEQFLWKQSEELAMKPFGLQEADILLPAGDPTRWSVVACDQYTSEPEYWNEVEHTVGTAPSTLRITLPEIYLNGDTAERISAINRTMRAYLDEGILTRHPNSMMYIERMTSSGVRRGLVGVIDLEEYDYRPGSKTLIRATEQTVVERIPPRVAIRRDAPLELPHVLLLMDDAGHTVMGGLSVGGTPVYDFDLMMGGGHIAGRLLNEQEKGTVTAALARLLEGQDDPLLFAVGDGNHSLATAKECYRQNPNPRNRYALVEVVNIHDPSIQFEPIYRVLFHADAADVMAKLAALSGEGTDAQTITCVTAAGDTVLRLAPTSKLPVGTLQAFLDAYLAEHPAVNIDYIHGEDTVRRLCETEGTLGFLFDGMGKEDLFPAIRADGSLPRKTFSMGHAADKRFYLECREI